MKVLYFTKSSAYEHSVIRRENGGLSFSEKILAQTGPRHGVEFTFTKDGSLITADYLAQFDAVMFYTSGDLCAPGKDGNPPVTPAGKTALLDAIRAGHLGFIGIHSAADTAQPLASRYQNLGDKADPYTRMLGGAFITHDKQQVATALVSDPKFPGIAPLGEKHTCLEEWYSLNDFTRDLHVILIQKTDGMAGPSYQRPDFPNTWARVHGKGRVFYTALGHREDTWESSAFQTLLHGAISWTTHQVDADITPNIETTTPGAWQLPQPCAKTS